MTSLKCDGKRDRETGRNPVERRSRHCLFRLLNVLYSESCFERFISSGDVSTRRELDEEGRQFWEEVAEGYNTINEDFDQLVSDDSLFEGIEPYQITTHSAVYVHLWYEQRGSGREFSASCVYEDNEDDKSRESQISAEKP
ncbi:hypothetical protein PC118_g15580 [Phytophthora cactorum]|uniref:Uncharacterized protein n=1 Tax=Phytophthora cactorum TaxID=29920 RepID=A0A8T1FDD2_9STRA|nr:hypothetical protein PC118_g15580 [Phytophthora cactorum]